MSRGGKQRLSLTYYMVSVRSAIRCGRSFESQLALSSLGVGIGFGLQNVVNNFVSGLILMFERPIQPGDVVEITGTTGTVREIGMRATMLTTPDGADAIIPNGTLLSEKLINWTLTRSNRRLDVDVGVAYGSDPRKVIALLEEVTRTTERVATDPPPAVLLTGFGPSSLNFGIRAWTNDFFGWVAVRTDLAIRVHDALKQAGIGIPFPQQDVSSAACHRPVEGLRRIRCAEPLRRSDGPAVRSAFAEVPLSWPRLTKITGYDETFDAGIPDGGLFACRRTVDLSWQRRAQRRLRGRGPGAGAVPEMDLQGRRTDRHVARCRRRRRVYRESERTPVCARSGDRAGKMELQV
jgi:hypothetical protein